MAVIIMITIVNLTKLGGKAKNIIRKPVVQEMQEKKEHLQL